jgi:ribosome biogenesis GTPase A
LGDEFSAAQEKLCTLRARLDKKRFHLAVLGQFKRGKSTLLNALLGEPVLPTSVIPLTSIPTFIYSGPTRSCRVHYHDNRPADDFSAAQPEEMASFLERFVTESGNPHNTLGVSHVDLWHPAPFLPHGLVLIDTPGIGSTFRHNTNTTLAFLGECDAALFLVSADPPMTEVEADFLKDVCSRVSRVFYILNKIDYLDERERTTAMDFFRNELKRHLATSEDIPIYPVSASLGLEAKQRGDRAEWARSGMGDLEGRLMDFVMREKTAALREAVAAKARAIVTDALLQLHLQIRSLQIPLCDLEDRLRLFERKLKETEQQRILAGDLLAGEKKRLSQEIERRAAQLRRDAVRHLGDRVQERLAQTPKGPLDEGAIEAVLAEAVPRFFDREYENLAGEFAQRVQETLRSHQDRALVLLDAIRSAASGIFEVPGLSSEPFDALEVVRQPHWVQHDWSASLCALPVGVFSRFLPPSVRHRRAIKRLLRAVEGLACRNVENLRWVTLQNLDQTLRRFVSRLDERFQETIAFTQGAIQATRGKRQDQQVNIAREIVRFQAIAAELAEIREHLAIA